MSLSALVFGSLAFGAGVIVGVILGEKGIVTSESMEKTGKFVVDTTMAAGRKVRDKLVSPEPSAPTA